MRVSLEIERQEGQRGVETLTAIIEREGDLYVATCPHFNVVIDGSGTAGEVDAATVSLTEEGDGEGWAAKRSPVGYVEGRARRRGTPYHRACRQG